MKILAVDYGDARTGLAVCDAGELLASPIGVIHQWNSDKLLVEVAEAAARERAMEIVVGNPLNMDGSAGGRSQLCHEFAEKLRERTGLPVRMWDERSTTVTATHYLNVTNTRGQKRKDVVDAVAATIILESYLNYRRVHKEG
ncbi:MAG: Holliday junction resolvase RuvX [Angelakisella sp.]